MEEIEIWKTYREKSHWLRKIEVSDFGRVKLGGKLKTFKLSNKQLYYKVCGLYVHRLVAELFVPNPDNKPEIDHIDTNKLNNNANNLRWVTRKENLNNPITLQHYSRCNKEKAKHRKNQSESARKKRSESLKALWKTQEYRDKILNNRPHKYKSK